MLLLAVVLFGAVLLLAVVAGAAVVTAVPVASYLKRKRLKKDAA